MARPRKATQEETIEESPRPTKASPRNGTRKRTPINGYRNILSIEGQEPGWHYCWVEAENVPKYENADYEFVTHDCVVGDRKINAASQIGGKISIPGGNGMTLYAMRVLEEYYQEDFEAVQNEISEKESAMKRELNSKTDGRYGSVSVEVNNRR
jgi:hypothetical protein